MGNFQKFGEAIEVGKYATDPPNPENGILYYNTTSDTFKVYQGGGWSTIASGSFLTALTGDVSATGPGSAAATVNSVGGATATEIGRTAGVTSAIQTQLNAKLNLSGGTLTGALVLSGDASQALNPISKQQFDAAVFGLTSKADVVVATTANITLSGEQTIDGVLTSTSRVLVKKQSTNTQNGIYVSASGSWTRATDFDSWAEVPGAIIPVVAGGTANGTTIWMCTAAASGTVGSTAVTFSQVSGPGTYTADGNALHLSVNQFSVLLADSTLFQNALGLKVGTVPYANLSLTGAIVNGDINASAAIAYSKLSLGNSIVNADIAAAAGIVDTKLATISTAGKVSNSATTATSANTNSAIVARDGSGNFSATTITATLTGTASNVTGIIAPANGGTGVANNAASTLTISGNFASTFTLSNTTAVTFPVSGTLATVEAAICGNVTVNVSSNVTLTNKAVHFVSTASARSLTLPAAATTLFVVVKDTTGNAATNNITITPASGLIDGAATFVMNANYESETFVSDGTNYFAI